MTSNASRMSAIRFKKTTEVPIDNSVIIRQWHIHHMSDSDDITLIGLEHHRSFFMEPIAKIATCGWLIMECHDISKGPDICDRESSFFIHRVWVDSPLPGSLHRLPLPPILLNLIGLHFWLPARSDFHWSMGGHSNVDVPSLYDLIAIHRRIDHRIFLDGFNTCIDEKQA